MNKKLLILLIFLSSLKAADSKDNQSAVYVGIFGNAVYNMHSGTFGTSEGIQDCGTFQDATSWKWAAGNYIEIPVFDRAMLSFRLFYQNAGADFSTVTPNPPNISLSDGTLVRLNTEQTLETSLDYINLSIIGKYYVYEKLYGAIGPVVGYCSRAAYSQYEQIISPQGVNFITGESKRKIISGNFGDAGSGQTKQLRFALHLGLGYDYPLSNRFVFNPEVAYQFAFTEVFTPSNWKVNSLFIGAGVKFLIGVEEKVIKEPAKEPEPTQPPAVVEMPRVKPAPVSSLQAKNVLKDGTTLNYSEIIVSDELTSFVLPLLPYVFYPSSDSKIPDRYKGLNKQETSQFSESNFRTPIELYHNLLNIVGKRLNQYPEAKITVTGCNESIDDTVPRSELSQNRANAIKEYLINTWSIAENRISVASRNLPAVVSNRQVAEGREENRRAEIYSDDWRILAPVKGNFIASTITPEAVSLEPNVQFPASVNSWNLVIRDNNRDLFTKNNTGAPETQIIWNYDKNNIADFARTRNRSGNLLAEFSMTSDSNRTANSFATIPVQYNVSSRLLDGRIVNDTIVERYVLLFFDFDKPKISKFNENTVSMIQQRIKTNSSLKIEGYTDKLGPLERNKVLSLGRAETVADAIRERIIPEKINVQGKGPTLIYDNELPEGRMYNRTVILEIYTPVEK